MNNLYIAIDTETGGLDIETTLLTAAFIVFDEDFKQQGTLYLCVKPDDGIYRVTAQGLAVNGINIVKHDAVATSMKEAGTTLYKFLQHMTSDGYDKLIPVGKNTYFDLLRVWQIVSRPTWEHFCSYQIIDINSAWRMLEITGKVSKLPKTSLTDLCNYLGVEITTLHDAACDAWATLECFKKMCELCSKVTVK